MAASLRYTANTDNKSSANGGKPPQKGHIVSLLLEAGERFGVVFGQLGLIQYLAIAIVITFSLLLRIFGDSFPAAPLAGAYAGRSTVIALLFIVVGLFIGVCRGLLLSRWPVSWQSFIRSWAFFGILFNIAATLTISTTLDSEINARIVTTKMSRGWVTVEYPNGDKFTVKPKPGGGYIISSPASHVPPLMAKAFWAIEDFRSDYRATGGIDVRAIARATKATLTGEKIEGASPVAETVGGLLFNIPRNGTLFERLPLKLKKFAIGLRIGDTLSRDEQVDLLGMLSTFGSLGGDDIVGVEAASRIYYGKSPEELNVAEAAELGSRLANPSRFSPYRRIGESEAQFERRHENHRERVEWAISCMAKSGAISQAEADSASREIFANLVPRDEAIAHLRPPFIASVFRELKAVMIWPSDRHIVVRVAATRDTQRALEDAVTSALPEIEARAGRRSNDQIIVDALAINADRVIIGRLGQWFAPSEQSSVTKIPILARALEDGVVSSLDEVIVDRPVRAAVESSHNETFIAINQRLGPERAAETLRSLGYSVDIPHKKLVLGGGVTATLPTVLAMFGAFAYTDSPGVVVPLHVIAEARDAETDESLIKREPSRFVNETVALAIRAALEGVARRGTAYRALSSLARTPIACKTGTSAYRDESGRLQGRGGSWIVASDSRTGVAFAIRVRWQSGEPFDVEAADSAAFVARHFIQNIRGSRNRS